MTNRDGREGSASSSGASHRAPMDASLPPSVSSLPMDVSLPPSVPSLPMERTASNGGISRLGAAGPASDSDLPPDVGADAELLVAEGSASFSGLSWHGMAEPGSPGMSWHGMAEPGSLDVDLPPDTDIVLNAWDDVTDEVDEVVGPQDLRWAGDHKVPSPAEALLLTAGQPLHDIAEFYSPPRVLPSARMRGLVGCFSLDLLTGWDLMDSRVGALARQLLVTMEVQVLILSPPCTAFSQLQALWNYKRMSAAAVRAKWAEGMAHLSFAVDCALTQHQARRVFLLEHPAAATSWKTRELQDLGSRAGVYSVVFDQCMTGLVSPCSGTPMRKRTKLMSNSMHFIEAFRGNMCDRSHSHQLVQGSEGGIRLSVWCQCYPAPMVDLLVEGAVRCKGGQ